MSLGSHQKGAAEGIALQTCTAICLKRLKKPHSDHAKGRECRQACRSRVTHQLSACSMSTRGGTARQAAMARRTWASCPARLYRAAAAAYCPSGCTACSSCTSAGMAPAFIMAACTAPPHHCSLQEAPCAGMLGGTGVREPGCKSCQMLTPKNASHPVGFEPTTVNLEGCCSIHLL